MSLFTGNLRSSSQRTARCIILPNSRVIVRSFSSSQYFQIFFPAPFAPTPSPELDQILEDVRRKLLLPRHLDTSQKKLVRDPQNAQQLAKEDIRVSLGDQEVQLQPFNFATDYISARDSFFNALSLSEKTGYFEFWPDFLKGYKAAALKFEPFRRNILLNAIGNAGKTKMIFDLLLAADQNGLLLTPVMVKTLVSRIRQDLLAVDSPQPEHVKKALSQIKRLNLIVARPEQLKELQKQSLSLFGVEIDILNNPILAALPLEIQSIAEERGITLDAGNGQDPQKSSADEPSEAVEDSIPPKPMLTASDYAERLLDALKKQPIVVPDLKFGEAKRTFQGDKRHACIMNTWMCNSWLVLSSIKTARKVVQDPAILSSLQHHQHQIEGAVEQVYASDLSDYFKFGPDFWPKFKEGESWALDNLKRPQRYHDQIRARNAQTSEPSETKQKEVAEA